MIRAIFIAVFSPFLAGCASTPPPPTSVDHPANADASATSLPSVTDLRAGRPGSAHETDPFAATAPAQQDKSDHSGHQMPSVKEAEKASTTRAAALYVCPMHPEVEATEPGKCPKCKMKLVKKGGQ